jgi:Ca2+/Na+ antiporter
MGEIFVSVLFNGFWVVGLAIMLSAVSYHYHEAQMNRQGLRRQLSARSFSLAVWVSIALVALGLAGTSNTTWEAAIWIAVTLYAIYGVARSWRSRSTLNVDAMSSSN